MTWLVSALLGGGIFAFVEFLITRKDNKEEKENTQNQEILDAIQGVKEDVKDVREEMERVKNHTKEREIISARTHILRFNDELINGIPHSHEYFLEIMDDVASYENYCDAHHDFKNGRTSQSCENIKHTYEKLWEKGEFQKKPGGKK